MPQNKQTEGTLNGGRAASPGRRAAAAPGSKQRHRRARSRPWPGPARGERTHSTRSTPVPPPCPRDPPNPSRPAPSPGCGDRPPPLHAPDYFYSSLRALVSPGTSAANTITRQEKRSEVAKITVHHRNRRERHFGSCNPCPGRQRLLPTE